MTPALPANTPPPITTPLRRRLGWVCAVIAALLLTILSYRPVETALEATLDSSNFSSYAHFTAHGFRFGKEVVAVSGPYGFINYGFVYGGELFWTRLGLELLVKAAFAALVIWFFRYTSARGWRWVWLASVFITAPLIEDTPYDLCILLAGIYLLLEGGRTRRIIGPILAASLLALLSLCKGTQVVFALATIGLCIVNAFVSRRYQRGLIIAAAYAVACVVLWWAAGQSLADVPAFLRGVQETASGYNSAMAFDEPWVTTRVGLLALLILATSATLAAWINRRHVAHVLACLFFGGFVFTQWKHGFVRADGHVFIFFIFAVPAALIPTLVIARETPLSRPLSILSHAFAALSLLIGLYAASYSGSHHVWLEKFRSAFPERIAQLLHPSSTKAHYEDLLAAHRTKYALPALKKRIADGSVDLLGSDHGYIPLNGMRYQPRPVGGGSFTVYTEYLKKLNESFLLDPARRPDFYLLKPEVLDQRLLMQDDSRSIPPFLYLYRPISTERSVVLFEKSPDGVPPPAAIQVETRHFRWGETIGVPVLPGYSDDIILATMDFELTFLGRIRAFFYKPPSVYLSLTGAGILHPESNRIIPAMMKSPVIISPAIENSMDWLALYTNERGKRVQDFRLRSINERFFDQDRLRVTFYRLPRPPADPNAVRVAQLTRFPGSNIGAERADPPAFPHYLGGKFVVGFHAPSQAEFPLDGTERAATFSFGMEPGTYTNHGATNGVTFIIDVVQPGSGPQNIFRRHLDPIKNAADRGEQSDHFFFPLFRPGSKLILRADPGPFGDNAWDWSYVTALNVEKGAYRLEQFAGFTTAPIEVVGDYAGIITLGQRPVFALNTPGKLVFALTGREQSVTFSGGFVEGAYTGEGHSDGAVYVAELQTPDGKTETIYSRLLNPRDNPGDRGLQTFTANIPAHSAGSKLIVRTDPGPANDTSWDWTYVCDLHITPDSKP